VTKHGRPSQEATFALSEEFSDAGDATHPLSPGGNAHRTTRSGRRMVRARFSAVRSWYDVIAVRRMGASRSGSVVVLEPSVWVWTACGTTGR
jgi:hypothetical protein